MTTDVLTASPSDTVAKTCARMLERAGGKVGSAIVTEGDLAVGIFTERDLVRAAAAGADLDSARVGEWMSANPDTVTPAWPSAPPT
jgi:CBS domain-containing protein